MPPYSGKKTDPKTGCATLKRQKNSSKKRFPKAPGQDLAQKGRFQRVPEGNFNCRPKGPQIVKICFQKAPGQDLAQKGGFPRVPEGDFNCRPKGLQIAEICVQKAPGQDLAQKGRFPRVPEGTFNCRPLSPPRVGSHMRSSMVGSPNAFVRVVNLLEPSRVPLRMEP